MREVCAEIRKALAANHKILLLAHENPDGDTLGSMLALWHFLAPEKDVKMVCADPLPGLYQFLPGSSELVLNQEALALDESYQLAVALDASDIGRLGFGGEELLARAEQVISIDHHASGEPFGDLSLVNPKAAATGELVYELLQDVITEPIATNLYTAIVTDCGSFRYPNTTAQTLQIAGELVRQGAKPHTIATKVFETRSLAGLRLLEQSLGSLEVGAGGKLGWMDLSRAMFQKAEADETQGEGFVNYVRMIEGVVIAILFREVPGGVRVSFRSRGPDVGKLAALFGGGGHHNAAGCELELSLPRAKALVLPKAESFLVGGDESL